MTDHGTGSGYALFDAMNRDALRSLAPSATVVIPLGSTEQHGHHLPTSTDATIVEAVARRAAARAAARGRFLVAPTLAYGCSHHHIPFGGTLTVTAATYVSLICDIVSGLAQQGFRSIVLLNGHGGNDAPIRVAVDRLTNELRCPAHVAAASYWTVATAAAPTGTYEPGHAGSFETSAMLALAPELVDLERRPSDEDAATPLGRPDVQGAKTGRPGLWEASDGRTDDARNVSVDEGVRIIEEITEAVAGFLVQFHESTPAGRA